MKIFVPSNANRKFAGDLIESSPSVFHCSSLHGANGSAQYMLVVQISLKLRFAVVVFEIILILAWVEAYTAKPREDQLQRGGLERNTENIALHSCIHDQILEQRKRPGRKVYSVTPQVYEPSPSA